MNRESLPFGLCSRKARKSFSAPWRLKANPTKTQNDQAEEALQALFDKIKEDFGTPPEQPDQIEESARNAAHKLEGRIQKLESGLDKFRDKNVAAMQRFIGDARNQAFRDDLTLDLEEGYKDETYASFREIRRQIEEEDLAKNRERFEELLRVQVPRRFQDSVRLWNLTGIVYARESTNLTSISPG